MKRRPPHRILKRDDTRIDRTRDLCPVLVMLAFLAAVQIALSAIDSTPRPISQLVHTRWTAKDGAPTDIRALAQTGDGYLWIGSLSGLVRFDGVRFVPFAPRGGDSIATGRVRSLLGGPRWRFVDRVAERCRESVP